MLDLRFYTALGPAPVHSLFPDAEIRGDSGRVIAGAASIEDAQASEVAWLEGRVKEPVRTSAGAVVVTAALASLLPAGVVAIVTSHPRAAFGLALKKLAVERDFQVRGPAIAPDVELEPDVSLAPGVVIGPGARIGAGTVLEPNVVIGPGVSLGRRGRIGAGAVLRCALVGDEVSIGPNSVIGEAGFGVAAGPKGAVHVPHLGRVVIQDRVRIGAGVAIDRGLFADTLICEGAKIDNLSHIAHNVVVGRNVVMAAFAGISGSSRIGDGAMLGGRVGVADHLDVGQGAQIAAGSAVLTDVPAGAAYGGYPAKPLRRFLREQAWLGRAASTPQAGKTLGRTNADD
jgi:UDP-3-O-[3-hydroxymyristoyl] glucosamine N-acyltransferase